MNVWIDRLVSLNAALCSGLPGDASLASRLPEDHVSFLRLANGAMGSQGYIRLFGIEAAACTDLLWWNDADVWKFAWPKRLSRYLVFGETGWGDQYAYDVDALLRADSRVFLLDAVEMHAEEIATGFSDFMEREFIRQAESPYDSMTAAAIAHIGPLRWGEHVTYVPSLLLGGDEHIENVVRINARANLIINGDIATQIGSEHGRIPSSIKTYQDDLGRLRVRVLWR